MNKVTYEQDSLTLTNTCPECIAQETLCIDCVEQADARLTDKAYEAASEGNLQYKSQWLINTQPSGHDWVASTTRGTHWGADDIREEFLLPIVMLQDGGELDNAWELDDYAQSKREIVCQWCNLTTPRMYDMCQSCDSSLERNVR